MPDEFGPQLLPDDNEASDDVWYCRSFGPGYEYEAASHSVVSNVYTCSSWDVTIQVPPKGETSKLPAHMGVHLTGDFDWELVSLFIAACSDSHRLAWYQLILWPQLML